MHEKNLYFISKSSQKMRESNIQCNINSCLLEEVKIKEMSHIIYSQNKVLCFIELSQELKVNKNPFLRINQLVLTIPHFQYPCIYYEQVFTHFRNLLPNNTTWKQLRFNFQCQQLPSDLPIGLFIPNQATITITISKFQIADPYNIIKQRWKQAFSAINPIKGNYYIAKQLGENQLKKRFQQYINGESHNFQKQEFQGYEGTNIVIRFLIQGQIIQRKSQTGENRTISDLIREEIPPLQGKKFHVTSHGVNFDLGMNLRQFLDEWNYNDGYCYLKIDLLQ